MTWQIGAAGAARGRRGVLRGRIWTRALALLVLAALGCGEAAAEGGASAEDLAGQEELAGQEDIAAQGAAVQETDREPPALLLSPDIPFPRLRPDDLDTSRPYRSRARNALIIDLAHSRTLYEKEPDRAIPPASMTKLMTLYVTLEAVKQGRLKFDTRLPVSKEAAATGGSTMNLTENQQPTLQDLIEGLIIVSGNDAAMTIAEGVGGTVENFVEEMNATAKRLRMTHSSFRNPTGLPMEGHRMSLYDLATLSQTLMTEHPEAHAIFARRHFTWNGITQKNRNPLLFADLDEVGAIADGLKTGYTGEAGYCAVVTAYRQEDGMTRRILAVIAGLPSDAARRREAERAIRWAFKQ